MDISVYETGSGGDFVLKGNNLELTEAIFNMPYLGLFGGNVEQSTPRIRNENEQLFDYWGNSLLIPNDTNLQYNSLTEKTLNETALNSSGRVRIQQAVLKDLAFMSDFADIEVQVSLITVDRVRIQISLTEPDNLNVREFIYLWDATKQEVISEIPAGGFEAVGSSWIMATGFWNDDGFWDDNSNWID